MTQNADEPMATPNAPETDDRDESASPPLPLKNGVLEAIRRSQLVVEFALDGTITDVNDKMLQLLAYEREELVGQHHRLLSDRKFAKSQDYAKLWETLAGGDCVDGVYKCRTKERNTLWLRTSYAPTLDETGAPCGVVALASEVTAEVAERAEREGKLRALDRAQAIIELDLDGTITTANNNFLKLVGYTLEEVQGQPHQMLVDEEYARGTEYNELWTFLRFGEYQVGTFKQRAKDGSDVWVQANYNPILDQNGDPTKVVGFATDVTKQMRHNAEAEGKIQAIERAQAVMEFDLDGTVLTANAIYLETMGYSLADVKGQHHTIFAEEGFSQSDEYRALWAKLREGEHVSGTYRQRTQAGAEVWLQASYNPILDPEGKPYKVVQFAVDITAQIEKNAEFARLSTVADGTDNSVIITDADGRIEYVNPGFTRLSGYESEEVIGKQPGEFLQGEHTDPQTVKRISEKLHSREPFYEEILNYGKHGAPYWISLTVNPIFDGDGQLTGFVSVQANIDSVKLATLEFTAKLEAISRANAVCELDREGRVESANAQFSKLVGRPDTAALIGTPLADLLVNPQLATQVLSDLASGRAFEIDLEMTKPDDHSSWFSASFSPIVDVAGNTQRTFLYGTDITERKRLEETMQSILKESKRVMEAVAEGDLSDQVQGDYEDDFEALQQAINGCCQRLGELVTQIQHSSGQITEDAQSLAQGNNALSARTTEQASSLEE
ncbi:MAG: PAS domain S-box protein, partial [Pseudomonadota bacterium]